MSAVTERVGELLRLRLAEIGEETARLEWALASLGTTARDERPKRRRPGRPRRRLGPRRDRDFRLSAIAGSRARHRSARAGRDTQQ